MSKKVKSQRYRFWRNLGIVLASALLGGLLGFLSGSRALEVLQQDLTSLSGDWILVLLTVLILVMCLSSYAAFRQVRQLMELAETTEDEDLALDYEAQANRRLNLVGLLANSMLVPDFFLMAYFLSDPERMNGNVLYYGSFLLTLASIGLAVRINRQAYKTVKGVALPRYANTKEQQAFLLSHMDEVEKQIYCEGSFELFLKLTTQILPFSLIGLLLVEMAFSWDISLAMVLVCGLYLYLLIFDYRMGKRYYK